MRSWLRKHLPVRTSTAVLVLFFVAVLALYFSPVGYQPPVRARHTGVVDIDIDIDVDSLRSTRRRPRPQPEALRRRPARRPPSPRVPRDQPRRGPRRPRPRRRARHRRLLAAGRRHPARARQAPAAEPGGSRPAQRRQVLAGRAGQVPWPSGGCRGSRLAAAAGDCQGAGRWRSDSGRRGRTRVLAGTRARDRGSARDGADRRCGAVRISPGRALLPGLRPPSRVGLSRPAAAGTADRPAHVRSRPGVAGRAAASGSPRLGRAGRADQPDRPGARRRPRCPAAGGSVDRGRCPDPGGRSPAEHDHLRPASLGPAVLADRPDSAHR